MKKYWLPALRLALVLLNPLAIVLACQLVSLQSLSGSLRWMLSSPGPVGMYWLTLLLAQLTLAGLTRLSGLAGLLAGLPSFALTLISYYKSAINGEPLLLSDLGLASHLEDIAQFAQGNLTVTFGIQLAAACIILPFLALTALDIASLRGRDPLRLSLRQGLLLSGTGGLLLALFLSAGLRPYCVEQHKAYPLQASRDTRLGISLSLLSDWYCSAPAPSASYSRARLQSILADMEEALDRQALSEDRPHIIFVMDESFFDITRLEGLTFSRDPLEHYHRLEAQTTYGRFYTVTCGGGTGCVEMEAFTGLAWEELGSGTANTDLEPQLYDTMPSYVRVLKENGYRTISFHAHTNELYNRDVNYPRLGFDQVLFAEDFPEGATYAGGYFDDDSAASVIISLFEKNRDDPLFLYTMTMQNHQPYRAGRYPQAPVQVSSPLFTPEELASLDCYTTGVYDADRMLGRLVDYFSQVEEPVILVFAGDHIPGLPLAVGDSLYTRLGLVPTAASTGWSAEDYQNMMATDYMIWSNCREPEGNVPASATMIGGTLLELAGVRSTPFFSWMAQTRRDTMLFHVRLLTLDPAGQLISASAPDIRTFRSSYTDVVYDLVYGEGYIAEAANRVRDP